MQINQYLVSIRSKPSLLPPQPTHTSLQQSNPTSSNIPAYLIVISQPSSHILHAPASLTSGSQGYANSAIPPPLTRADVAAMIKTAYTKGVQEGKNMNNNNNNRNSNRNAHNTPTRPPNQPKYATKYCFVHGYNFSHIGTECKVMANDPTSTPQHKSATNSTTGGNANVQQA
jgi:hypothetical protein